MKPGIGFGNPGRDIGREIRTQVGNESKKAALRGIGIPEHLVEGYFMSKEGREMGETKFGLGTRILANLVWTFGIAGLSIYSFIEVLLMNGKKHICDNFRIETLQFKSLVIYCTVPSPIRDWPGAVLC